MSGLLAGALLLLSGCYNKPGTSSRKPGEGPEHIHAGPSVGPGTVAGGSTAGPQPKPVSHGGNVQPMPSGGHPAAGSDGHLQPATPVHEGKGETPTTGSAQTGNEHGAPGRGPAADHDGAAKKH
jgi:hypothetical protein